MGFGTPPTPPTVLEGDYSTYTYKWKQSYHAGESDYNQILRVDKELGKIFIINEYDSYLTERVLADGSSPSVTGTLNISTDLGYMLMWSILRKYFAYVINDGGPKLKIYKDGALLQTIDLSVAPISWVSTLLKYYVSISPNGEYIFINNTVADEYALFEGS